MPSNLDKLTPTTPLSKILTVVFGLICIGFSYVAANLGGILQAAMSINGMLGGPTTGMFLLAFFNPWSESIGVAIGYIVGIGMGVWCYIGSTVYPPYPEFIKELPTQIIGCQGNYSSGIATIESGRKPI